MIKRWNQIVSWMGIFVLVNLSACVAPASTAVSTTDSDSPIAPETASTTVLARLAEELSQGRLEDARLELTQLDPNVSAAPRMFLNRIESIISRYDRLSGELQQAHEKAYQNYAIEMLKAVDAAHWRQTVLEASKTYKLASEDKTSFESDLSDKLDKDWLKALAKMTQAYGLAKRTGLSDTTDPALREEITRETLRIAAQLEDEHETLEAYNSVYAYLSALAENEDPYKDERRKLIRQATLRAMYVADPNMETVAWEERRKNVTADIFEYAINILSVNYVEEPDFRRMAQEALEAAALLAQTDGLEETFPQLTDTEKSDAFIAGINELTEKCKTITGKGGYLVPIQYLRRLLDINKETLALPEEVVVAEYAEGAFGALDSYTYVVWPADVDTFQKDMTNEFSGIGVQITKKDGRLAIDSLLEDAPAFRAGLDAGDIIAAVDGKSTDTLSMNMAVDLITGPAGTDVVLTIERAGEEPKDYTITREKIVVKTVKGLYRDEAGQWQYYVDPDNGIGYIRLTNFAAETSERLQTVIQELRGQNLKGLILDLRNNSGGYLNAAIAISNLFLQEGVVIVSTRPRDTRYSQYEYASKNQTGEPTLPLVVLIDGTSASASEIVAGALKDHHRAVLVGTRSFGKGSVQTIQNFRSTNAEMKLTIAYYYLPGGRRVHRDIDALPDADYGVVPDIEVELTADQFKTLYETRNDAGVLYQNGEVEHPAFTAKTVLDNDPQLQAAVLCLEAKLIANGLMTPASEKAYAAQPILETAESAF
ncbi:MAG: PDZ domain-containing protein [Sedimentisphaerales bacterium]|nr:PDZ domain-containing protein [Sedimentisphaerales bacterium]